ncbi:hypothetical protein HDU96_009616 [Phlyctochytrium bullatum]|nr:hypothetical protein HDU96_009616 [Phlyctochytrium bullatum]
MVRLSWPIVTGLAKADTRRPSRGDSFAERRQDSVGIQEFPSDWRRRESAPQVPPPRTLSPSSSDRGGYDRPAGGYGERDRGGFFDRDRNRGSFSDRDRGFDRNADRGAFGGRSINGPPEDQKKSKSNPFGAARPRDESEYQRRAEERRKEREAQRLAQEQAAKAAREEEERRAQAEAALKAEAAKASSDNQGEAERKTEENDAKSSTTNAEQSQEGSGSRGGSFRGRGRGGVDRSNSRSSGHVVSAGSWRRASASETNASSEQSTSTGSVRSGYGTNTRKSYPKPQPVPEKAPEVRQKNASTIFPMASTFTREDVAKHNKPDDLWIIIDDHVFDLTGYSGVAFSLIRLSDFAELHPGSAVVLWSVAGKDATGIESKGLVLTSTEEFYALHRSEVMQKYFKKLCIGKEREVAKDAPVLDVLGERPSDELFVKMGEFGLLACRLGPGDHLKGLKLPGGVKPEEVIGLPPVMKFGPKWMKEKVVPEVISGRKKICLAISEPGAGSDVSNVQCTATKSKCGKFYLVNGVKKWITNGSFSDYFTTDVVYENVKVPVENLIGEENKGFPVIMANFNHERWSMVVGCARGARLVTEECFKWATQRKVFGKPLIEQPVIRFKLGQMLSQVEAVQASMCHHKQSLTIFADVELLTYQMNKMSFKEQNIHLAGPIALAKLNATRMTLLVSDNAVQIFGGRALTRTGMGRIIEQFQRTNNAILGGAEEVMADLGVRMAMKAYPPTAKL